jgi:prepilin-type N-terminal cleavage/methylation domain-containing protein
MHGQQDPPKKGYRRAAGFTLVELLVVIGIIVVLITILLPVLNKARDSANRSACISNQRQLVIAWMLYAQEHKGRLLDPNTNANSWVDGGNDPNVMTKGLLFPYLASAKVYRCPSDVSVPQRPRSYSINDYLAGNYIDRHVYNIAEIKRAPNVFVFVEENDPREYNHDSFVILYEGDVWVDHPARFHRHGCTLSFADCHAEYWFFKDPRTVAPPGLYPNTPNNPDLVRFQRAVGYYPDD